MDSKRMSGLLYGRKTGVYYNSILLRLLSLTYGVASISYPLFSTARLDIYFVFVIARHNFGTPSDAGLLNFGRLTNPNPPNTKP